MIDKHIFIALISDHVAEQMWPYVSREGTGDSSSATFLCYQTERIVKGCVETMADQMKNHSSINLTEKYSTKSRVKIRNVSYEYSGADRHIDLFFESAIHDFYGSRLLPHTNHPLNSIQKVESAANAEE